MAHTLGRPVALACVLYLGMFVGISDMQVLCQSAGKVGIKSEIHSPFKCKIYALHAEHTFNILHKLTSLNITSIIAQHHLPIGVT